MRRIVLASASPRRKALLEQIGMEFEVDASELEETLDPGLEPHQLARRMSLDKAHAVAPKHPDALIIAADTFGLLRGRLLGKPRDATEAKDILATLSGQAHSVITGYTILDTATGREVSRSVETVVHLRRLTAAEIDAYVGSGEPLDKAGAYAIQGRGAVLVDRIEGDFYNVIGLPLAALAETLKEFDIRVL